MSVPLTPEQTQQFTAIIDGILATANLETITRKKIRQGLETSLGGRDLSEHKNAIKKLIIKRFDANFEDQGGEEQAAGGDQGDDDEQDSKKRPSTNGYSDAGSDPSASPEPARKKAKRSSSAEDADARLAAELQAHENRLARGRSTRGGGDKKAPKKKAPKKKSTKKVAADDDSEVDGSDAPPKPKRGGGGFQKPFNLSPALSELTGETQLSRPGVVKSLWQHIKANELQDPSDRRQILCDEKMQAVFKTNRVDMFRMNKEISNHLYPVEEA